MITSGEPQDGLRMFRSIQRWELCRCALLAATQCYRVKDYACNPVRDNRWIRIDDIGDILNLAPVRERNSAGMAPIEEVLLLPAEETA